MATEQPPPLSPSPQLRCTITTIPEESDESNNAEHTTTESPTSSTTLVWNFQQEEGKKSSFVLDFSQNDEEEPFVAWETPAHIVIDCVLDNNNNNESPQIPFLLGGLELVTNSRNMEVYLTKSATSSKEDYLMACRGIPASQQQQEHQHQWHKTLSVIPGGPRSVVKLHLKLLSLRPDTTKHALLKSIKLKGRLPLMEDIALPVTTTTMKTSKNTTVASVQPPVASIESQNSVPSPDKIYVDSAETQSPMTEPQPHQASHEHQHPNGPTSSPFAAYPDLGMAFLAGISTMLRATEDRIMQTMQSQISRQIHNDHQQLAMLIYHNQQSLMDQQQKLLQQQGQVLENQGRILQQLESRQAQLIADVSNLQMQLQQALLVVHHVPAPQPREPETNTIQNDRERDIGRSQSYERIQNDRERGMDRSQSYERIQSDRERGIDRSQSYESIREVVTAKDLLVEDPVQDDDDEEEHAELSFENRQDVRSKGPEKDVAMEDLLQLLESETPQTPSSHVDNAVWNSQTGLPNEQVFGSQLLSNVGYEKNDTVEDLIQWHETDSPSENDREPDDKFDHLRQWLPPSVSNESDDGSTAGSQQPVWIIGEGTDDMVVIHGLPPQTSLPEPSKVYDHGGYDPSNELPLNDTESTELLVLEEQPLETVPQSLMTLSKVRDLRMSLWGYDELSPSAGSADHHHRHHHVVHHREASSDESHFVVTGASSWQGTQSQEDDGTDIPTYPERPCSSY